MTHAPTTSTAATEAIDRLRASLTGRVVTPDDADYDELRVILPGGFDLRPAAIVRVADAADVARVVTTARATGVELAVRSGGHSGAAHGLSEGGIVLDVRDLDSLDIDVPGKTAWAGSGLTAAAYTQAVGEHGLATGFGDTGSVGLGGITLGGGVGYLGRLYGLTIDSLLGAEIVTADGEIRNVDADHDPDLFWAIRGGGGNFGVVTRFQYQLHDVPSTVGGMLVLPATPETVAGWVAASDAAPEALSTIGNVMPCPPLPFVPESEHGKLVIFGILVYAGDTEAGQAAIAPFRALAEPLADMIQEQPYAAIYPPEDADYHPTAVSVNLFMDRLGLAEATTIMEHLEASDAGMRVAQLRVLGGAIGRVPNDATAYGHRDRPIMVNLAAFYEGPEEHVERQAWMEAFAAAVRQGPPAAYVNFINDEGPERVRDAYPAATWDRLTAIKARYDPTNLFHRNQNLPPATGAGTGA